MTPILLLIRICAYHFLALLLPLVLTLLTLTGCTRQLIETSPEEVTDVSDVVITCDATQGNKGLLDYEGDVYIHLGLITSKSKYKDDWQHVKFAWGSRDTPAQAKPAGKNKWSYSIKNIRKFFEVDPDEKIDSLCILFRSGACIDIYCKVLRHSDGGNIYIPVDDRSGL